MSFKNILLVLLVILVFVIIEILIDDKKDTKLYNKKDTINNFLIGLLVILVNSNTKLIFYACMYVLYNYRLLTFEFSILNWALCILAADFTYYIYHRTCHGVNWFWVSHAVHHSSEHLNMSTSFRLSITNNISGHFVFWLWMPFLGFHPIMCIVAHFVIHAYQSWLHTELIGKLPRMIEFLFNTPSHHRVHHGSNPEYLDKNHGGILIIWDRIFSSFCEEKERPVYGLSHHPELPGPKDILFKDWSLLIRKCRDQKSIHDMLKILIAKPGADVFKK